MSAEMYYRLREQLDQYGVGYPATESGVEMKILEKLFTEEDAQMFLNMSLMMETPDSVAKRLNQDPVKVAEHLDAMAQKGLLYRLRKDGKARYSAVPFVIGIYEFQINAMDKELAQLCDQYFREGGFLDQIAKQTSPLRPIPVNRSVDVSYPIAAYEDARGIIKKQEKIAVANCICRLEKGLLNEACGKPLEVCLAFGPQADYYVELGMARYISTEEALDILELCDKEGLVHQPNSSQNVVAICNCCGDCCAALGALKKHPKPAEIVLSNYYAVVDPDLCCACETCLDRCQMDAISMGPDDLAVVNLDRCIGCGLCVTTCETGALTLEQRPEDKRREPPAKYTEYVANLSKSRGKSLIPLSFK